MRGEPEITAVIINFRTPDLTRHAISTFRTFYPSTRLLLIDNGSGDTSEQVLGDLRDNNPLTTELIVNRRNLHHGPAMNQALHHVSSPLVFFLDSDCAVLRGGFLEQMTALCTEEADRYVVGKKIWMNRRGFDVTPHSGDPYIRPICMMIRRDLYLTLPPFERHGAPCLTNLRAAASTGLQLVHFPVEDYVHHRGRGTASLHGYRLGLRGKLNHLLHKLGL